MKKFSFLSILIFLVLFVYFYTRSGKFRQSIVAALAAGSFYFSVLPPAHAANGADAFTPQPQQHTSRPQKKPGGIFSQSNNDGSGPGKPGDDGSGGNDDGIPKYPQSESVEKTEKRVERITELSRRIDEVSDSETETDDDQCQMTQQDKAGFKELPDSKKFSYRMNQGRGLKKQADKVWKNPTAKKELLKMLKRFDNDTSHIQEKSLKGFKSLTELKNSGPGPRILIHRGKNEQPTVVGFCMRDDLVQTLEKLGQKYK